MIEKEPWQIALADLVKDVDELFQALELEQKASSGAKLAAKDFPLKIPRAFLRRIKRGDINDPLLRQILPLDDENQLVTGFFKDPLGEIEANKLPGLLHKYVGRVLVTLTSACAVHCRYCFRRHFPYSKNNPGSEGWQAIFDYVAQDSSITEVILSGGDPLTLTDKRLMLFSERIKEVKHVTTLRIHSRIPIYLPERITDGFIKWLKSLTPLQVVLVTHANHPNEMTTFVCDQLKRLRDNLPITLLNQSVLLKGVNDNVESLATLSKLLFKAGVLPYYLHLLDKVTGTQHFEIETNKALSLYKSLKDCLPGYLVPKLAIEEKGAHSKTILSM